MPIFFRKWKIRSENARACIYVALSKANIETCPNDQEQVLAASAASQWRFWFLSQIQSIWKWTRNFFESISLLRLSSALFETIFFQVPFTIFFLIMENVNIYFFDMNSIALNIKASDFRRSTTIDKMIRSLTNQRKNLILLNIHSLEQFNSLYTLISSILQSLKSPKINHFQLFWLIKIIIIFTNSLFDEKNC